jgi:hypothetical protein
MSFATWLDTHLTEKGIALETMTFSVEIGGFWGHAIVEGAALLDALRACSPAEQTAIKTMLVKLDFLNSDPVPFFEHLAAAMARQLGGA